MSAQDLSNANWDSASPSDAANWLSNISVSWWIAGGWALDLFLGRETRLHGDLDIGVLRRDVATVLRSLSDWETFEAKDGALTPLVHTTPSPGVNSLWCRRVGAKSWKFEFMLDESDGEFWLYRRDSRIRRSVSDLVHHTSSGIPYLAPEVQLLYKAKHTRSRDEADFQAVIAHLGEESRNWLRQSLVQTLPSHPWISVLESYSAT
ncbi:MAG: nucleotidyltransferase domain-containing protein [Gammaproteobacteria bacterium]